MKKIAILVTLILISIILWMARYSIYTNHEVGYRLDRFTGSVTVLYGGREISVKYVERKKPDLSFLPDKPAGSERGFIEAERPNEEK